MSLFRELLTWLVEGDVTVVADAQQLNVHAAGLLYQLLIALALCLQILCGAAWNAGVFLVDVDVVEQIVVHKVTVALVVVAVQSCILVQVDSFYMAKVHSALVVHLNQLFIHSDRSGAGCQTQHAVRF